MAIQWAGGVTRETCCCVDCGTKKRPLKWYDLWDKWLCPGCNEKRVIAELSKLDSL